MSNPLTITTTLIGMHLWACSDGGANDIFSLSDRIVNVTSGLPSGKAMADLGPDVSVGSLYSPLASLTGSPTAYLWKKLSGPGIVSFSEASALEPEVSFDSDGDYVISLTISNGYDSASGELKLSVKASKPVATITGNPEDINADTVLDVSVSSTEDGYFYYKLIETDAGIVATRSTTLVS